MDTKHRWNTKEYEARTKQLYRTELHKLYPSEAWALYRILPECKSVLDLGCGNGAMAAIAKKISPETKYTGMDHQSNLMQEARKIFPFANFAVDGLLDYITTCDKYDCVMSWSVIKSFKNWRELISCMLDKANKYVICDIRVANTDTEAFDNSICWADYGGIKGPIMYLNYSTFRDALLEHKEQLSRVEIAAYQSEWGKFVHLKDDLNPETFLVTCVLTKRNKNNKEEDFELFERLPGNLINDPI